MRILILAAAMVVFVFTFGASGQDPTKAAPDSYKLQMENAYVRVLRVRYAPHSKVPMHDHSRYPAAYVYLVDSGPVKFIHEGWNEPVLTRPATGAGSFRLSPTRFQDERHEVENPGPTASEFLRIEIMTEAPDRKSLYGRFDAFKGSRSRGLNKVEFENSQLKATRVIDGPVNVTASANEPALLVVLATGETVWLAPGETKKFAQQTELLRFDFKTKPIR